MNYQEVIQEMGRRGSPRSSRSWPPASRIGYDLMVITNGIQFKQFVAARASSPRWTTRSCRTSPNAGAAYKKRAYDPGNVYSVPWASGMTGIAYDPEKIKTRDHQLADLWDPAFKGKVGMFSDTQELANFGLLALGINPAKSTAATGRRPPTKLKKQKDAGIVRKYYDQSYIDALGTGDIWITQAWSGDIFQQNISDGHEPQVRHPDEGGTIWTDNMTIPITAAEPGRRDQLIDFFYQPDIAASLAEYINYISPVPAAKEIMLDQDADSRGRGQEVRWRSWSNSPLVFPPRPTTPSCTTTSSLRRGSRGARYFKPIFQPTHARRV